MKPLHLFALLALAAPAAADTCLDIPECKENYPAYQQLYDVKYKNEHDEYSRFLERYNSFSKDRDYHFTGKAVWEAEPLSSDAWGRKWAEHWKDYKKGKTKGNPWQMEVDERTKDLEGFIDGYDAAKKLDDELIAAKPDSPKTFQSMLDKRIQNAFPGEMGREKFKVIDVIYAYLDKDARDFLLRKKEFLAALRDHRELTPEQVHEFGPAQAYKSEDGISSKKKEFGKKESAELTARAKSIAAQLNDNRSVPIAAPDKHPFLGKPAAPAVPPAGTPAAPPAARENKPAPDPAPASATAHEAMHAQAAVSPEAQAVLDRYAASGTPDKLKASSNGRYVHPTAALLADWHVLKDERALSVQAVRKAIEDEIRLRWTADAAPAIHFARMAKYPFMQDFIKALAITATPRKGRGASAKPEVTVSAAIDLPPQLVECQAWAQEGKNNTALFNKLKTQAHAASRANVAVSLTDDGYVKIEYAYFTDAARKLTGTLQVILDAKQKQADGTWNPKSSRWRNDADKKWHDLTPS